MTDEAKALVERAKAEAMTIRYDQGILVRVYSKQVNGVETAIWSKVDENMADLTHENSDGLLYHVRSVFVPHGGDNPLALTDLIETQAREIERLRGVLKFYARKYNWKSCGVYMCGHSNPSSAEIDRGNKARAAIGDSHDQ